MDAKNAANSENKILTIPNLLTTFRIILIPGIAVMYLKGKGVYAAGLMLLSGVTDIVDGFVARRFQMVSNLGKILDPVADKLTQVVLLICMALRFPWVIAPIVMMVIKEVFMSITGILVIRRTGQVLGAVWHGKAATVVLFATIVLHICWYDIPEPLSIFMCVASCVMILVSFVLYGIRNIQHIQSRRPEEK